MRRSFKPDSAEEPVLEVEGLSLSLDTPDGPVTLVDDVSFTLRRGQTLGVVGESGSGKTMMVRSIVGIAPRRAKVTGRIRLGGADMLALPPAERRRRIGAELGMVFQNPMTSLNPVVPIGRQIGEALRFHRRLSRAEVRRRSADLLTQVGISDPDKRLKQYPHQLSGGMRQRVLIASALACDPKVLIADEATTALDVTVQKQILDLIKAIQAERNMSVVIISHDLGVVAGRTDELAVMYGGQVIEYGPTEHVFARNRHRYTAALLSAIPDLDAEIHSKLNTIPGSPPRPSADAVGCRFAPRCPEATDECRVGELRREFDDEAAGHWFRCRHPRPIDPPAGKAPGTAPAADADAGPDAGSEIVSAVRS